MSTIRTTVAIGSVALLTIACGGDGQQAPATDDATTSSTAASRPAGTMPTTGQTTALSADMVDVVYYYLPG